MISKVKKELAINEIHRDLISISSEIGGICDMACWASAGMAAMVHNTGKQVLDITIGELMGLLKAHEGLHACVESMCNQEDGL